MQQSKTEIVESLKEIANLLEIADANTFEIMAHRNAARSLEEWSGDLPACVEAKSLTEIQGVGKGIAQVITVLAQSGTSPALEQARANVPATLPLLLRIPGLGPKRVRALWTELEIESLDDLKRAINEDRMQSLRGFGAKTIERIASGLERLNQPRPSRSSASTPVTMEPAAPATGQIWAGTSGFSYPQWKGSFYPENAKTTELLTHYAQHFRTVEINNTFYRFPSSKVVQQWLDQTSPDFRFAIKAHRRITHTLRLGAESASTITDFVARCGELGTRLGCILFQLPPNFARDDSRLRFLLNTLPSGPRYAIEFRHASWFDDDVLTRLAEHNVSCATGAEDRCAQNKVTADFLYVRLGTVDEDSAELNGCDEWFREQTAQRRDVWVYLKHDDEGATPQAILNQWPYESAAKTRLKRELSKPAAKSSKRRRKSG